MFSREKRPLEWQHRLAAYVAPPGLVLLFLLTPGSRPGLTECRPDGTESQVCGRGAQALVFRYGFSGTSCPRLANSVLMRSIARFR